MTCFVVLCTSALSVAPYGATTWAGVNLCAREEAGEEQSRLPARRTSWILMGSQMTCVVACVSSRACRRDVTSNHTCQCAWKMSLASDGPYTCDFMGPTPSHDFHHVLGRRTTTTRALSSPRTVPLSSPSSLSLSLRRAERRDTSTLAM